MTDSETDQELRARRAASFGGEAAAYARERPDYPDAVVRWVLEPLGARRPLRVLDLAAGTGKMTETLLRVGVPAADVVAVEPDPGMLAELRRAFPEVRALEGRAEEIPLADGSVDAIVVGQALHWFDLGRAYPEMARVLAGGGVLAAVWNRDDASVPWVAGLQRVLGGGLSQRSRSGELPVSAEFPEFERAEFPHVQRRTAESLAATIGTHSHMLVLGDAERAEVEGRILGHLRATPETAEGEFDLPMVTLGVRARRG
ncbi:class I SAM-dependent methyltransferase [Actinomadura barringtoniae]|uniref:Class I SAM-dependent methyltransferase n=1 Tax=Actinomadura barringtoniae TaxID=1427535 RepID=A0A939PCA4_9ACTN|nr:class I SAM-dependent methyltransferase [Actinomadura barringtoniae]MBO2449985.1 class I SAM-dependent methyltransferase [Actinomadura barringtoniae]